MALGNRETPLRPRREIDGDASSLAAGVSELGAYLLVALMPLTVFLPLAAPVRSERDAHPMFVGIGVDLPELAALLVVLFALFGLRRSYSASPRFLLPLSALAVLGFATAPFALRPSLAFSTACRWALAVGFCWAVPRLRLRPRRLTMVLLVTLAAQSLIGVGQVVLQRPLGLPMELTLAPSQPGAAVLFAESERWLRPYGLTFHPNVLAGFLVAGLLLSLPLLDRRGPRLLWWVLWLGLFLTFSRSAWLAFALAMPFAVVPLYRGLPGLRSALVKTGLGALIVTLVAGSFASQQLARRLHPLLSLGCLVGGNCEEPSPGRPATGGSSVSDRLEMSRLALRFAKARPASGVGAGGFPLAMIQVRSPLTAQYVHDVPLLLAAEIGVAGGVCWLWLSLAGPWSLVRGRGRLSRWGTVSLCAWGALATIALFDCYPWTLGAGRLLTAALLGLSTAFARPVHRDGAALRPT